MEFFSEFKEHWFRFSAMALIGVAVAVYLGSSIRNLQYSLLYYPSSSMPDKETLRACNIRLWQTSGADYRGLVAAGAPASGRGTVIVFHGNGGAAADRTFYLDALGALGYRAVLAEYPLYGGRGGELGEKAFVSDARESMRLAFKDFGGPFFVLGESMGCGIAASAVREAPVKVDGLILITPWDTLASIAREKFPFLPVNLLLKDQYDNIANLSSFKGKIAVAAAGQDEIIPPHHAETLYSSFANPAKKLWIFREAGHNDWYAYADMAWWKEVTDFLGGKEEK